MIYNLFWLYYTHCVYALIHTQETIYAHIIWLFEDSLSTQKDIYIYIMLNLMQLNSCYWYRRYHLFLNSRLTSLILWLFLRWYTPYRCLLQREGGGPGWTVFSHVRRQRSASSHHHLDPGWRACGPGPVSSQSQPVHALRRQHCEPRQRQQPADSRWRSVSVRRTKLGR